MKKILFIISFLLLSFTSIFAYEKNFEYSELNSIKKYNFAIIIFEDERWAFEFKGKKYNPKYWVKFLEDYKWLNTKVEKNNLFLENFNKNKENLTNFYLIRVDLEKEIDIIKVVYNYIFSDLEKLSKKEFLESIESKDILEIWSFSFSDSAILRDSLTQKNIKMKYLFEKIWIDKEVLDFFQKKIDRKNFINDLFLKLLENEIYNSGKNKNLLLN